MFAKKIHFSYLLLFFLTPRRWLDPGADWVVGKGKEGVREKIYPP